MGLCKKQTAAMTLCFSKYATTKGMGVCPNYFYPSSMWDNKWRFEADIICVNDDLMIYEVEVKRSVIDFNQECSKANKFRLMIDGEYYTNYFSYLFPVDLYEKLKDKVDINFGIYTVNNKNNRITEKRAPTLLKKDTATGDVYASILKQATKNLWRYYEKSNKL